MFKNKFFVFGVIIIVLYYLPYLILNEESYIVVHDNLDGEFVLRKIISSIKGDYIEQIMNGISGSLMISKSNILILIFKYFTPFVAYILNDLIVRIMAFTGVYLLVEDKIFFKKNENRIVIVLISLCYSFIPFYSIFGITVAGIPLLIYSFLNLKNKTHLYISYLIIVFFAFYSSFVLIGVFVLIVLFSYWLYMLVFHNKFYFYFILGIFTLASCYFFIEFNLISAFFFDKKFISHRALFRFLEPNLEYEYTKGKELFFNTQYHSGKLKTKWILCVGIIVLLFKRSKKIFILKILLLVLIIVMFSIIYPFIRFYFGDYFSILKSFQFDRFYFFLPILWILLLAFSLRELLQFKKKMILVFVNVFLLFQIIITMRGDRYYVENIKEIIGYETNRISYSQFYAKDLFFEIDKRINKDKSTYKIASLGLHPASSQFNGFYTLDGYITNYNISYKFKFREIIEDELKEDIYLKKYFDDWGSRVYIYSSELKQNYIINKTEKRKVLNFKFNTDAFRKMGGEYLISAVEIINHEKNDLVFIDKFENNRSFYQIFLYKVK